MSDNATNLFEVTLCEENPDEYLTNPYFNYTYTQKGINGITNTEKSATFSHGPSHGERMAFYIVEIPPLWSKAGETAPNCVMGVSALNSPFSEFTIFLTGSITHYDQNGNFTYSENFTNSALGVAATGEYSGHVGSPRYPQYGYLHYDTNIPFFSTVQEAKNYIMTGEGIGNALNYKSKLPNEYTYNYYIYNTYILSQPNLQGEIVNESSSASNFLQFNPSDTKLALYQTTVSIGNPFNLRLVGTGSGLFSSNGETYDHFDSPPIVDFINKMIVTGGIQYNVTLFDTNIPIFDSADHADGYLHNTYDIDNALNYDDLKDNDAMPDIGTEETATDLPVNYLRSHFYNIYGINSTNLSEITNLLFDVSGNLFEQIMEGLSLYGTNPMDFVIDLIYFPLNVLDICSSTPVGYIYFGGYQATLNANVAKIIYNNTLIDMGSYDYIPAYNDYRDFEPFTQCYLYLPYVGTEQLQISSIINKTLNIKYGIDIATGACKCFIFADSVLINTFEGQVGIKLPITGTNNAQWASNMIHELSNVVTAPLQASPSAATDSLLTGANLATATAIPVVSKGNIVSNVEKFAPQYPYIIFARQETIEPTNLRITFGKPTNTIAKVNQFSGYLQADLIHLSTTATASEQSEIESLLNKGIII